MKFHVLPILASTGALAFNFNLFRRDASIEEHQLVKRISSFAELMITDLTNLTTITNNITATIKTFVDPKELGPAIAINTATQNLFSALDKATADAKTGTTLSSADSSALGPVTQFLAYAANASIAALISKKALFEETGLGSTVVSSLQMQISASNNFSSILLSKIPENLVTVSNALNSQVVQSLNQGLSCFEGKNETCNPNAVNASRTLDAAQESGAIPSSAAERTMELSGLLAFGAAVVAGVLFAA